MTLFLPDGLFDAVRGVSGECVVEVSDEVVAVLLGQGHEGAAHHDELDLVHAVAELLELEKEGGYVFTVWKRRIFPREFIRL